MVSRVLPKAGVLARSLPSSLLSWVVLALTLASSLVLVHDAVAGQLTLQWNVPTLNEDGSPLTDLAGYKIYYGTASGTYSSTVDVQNVTTYHVAGLTPGSIYYFAVTTYTRAGLESSFSNEVSGVVRGGVPTTPPGQPGAGAVPSAPAVPDSNAPDQRPAVWASVTATPVVIDGVLEEAEWRQADYVVLSNPSLSDNQAIVRTLWDNDYLYFAYDVRDYHLETDRTGTRLWRDDGAEIYLDTANDKTVGMGPNDYHFIINIDDIASVAGIHTKTTRHPDGYVMEIAIPWGLIDTVPVSGKVMGILLGNNDSDNGRGVQFDWPGLITSGHYGRPNLWANIVLE